MSVSSGSERRVKVFNNGRSRAVRIPKEFDFGGDEVILRKEGNDRLVIEPVRKQMSPKELIQWLRSQPPLDEDFPGIDDNDMLPLDDIKF